MYANTIQFSTSKLLNGANTQFRAVHSVIWIGNVKKTYVKLQFFTNFRVIHAARIIHKEPTVVLTASGEV